MKQDRTGERRNVLCAFGTRGRRLYLVDAENIEGTGRITVAGAVRSKLAIMGALPPGTLDHVVVGTSHPKNAVTATGAWARVRHVIHQGHDGADLALLDVLKEDIAARFSEVVIVSGDGIFTDDAAALARQGVKVTVLTRKAGLSARLRMAASRVIYLTEDQLDEVGEAA